VAVFFYAWRNRSGAGIKFFAWSILFEFSWLIGYFIEVNSSSLETKVFWDNVQYIGAFLAPVFLVGFAAEFTDIKINTRRLIGLLSIIPILLLLVIFSYQAPQLIRVDTQIQSSTPFNELTYGFGTLAWLGNNYLYLVSLAYLAVLVSGFFRKISVSRSQLTLVLIGTLIPILGSILGLAFGWEFANQRDISPLTFALSNAIIAFGIFRYRLFNVIPIARQALFDTIDDLLIVLDSENRVVDANPTALKVFGWEANQLTDISMEKVLPDLYSQYKNIQEARVEVRISDDIFYDLKITPVLDRSGNLFGRLISAHDISIQKKVEQDLQRTNEQNRQRATQFRAIAQVSSSISAVQELPKTLSQIAVTLSQQLGHYHVGIFLVDSTFQYAILQAANSEGGQVMLAQGHRLHIGDTGIVSAAIKAGKPQIALDVDQSKIYYPNPYLPNTKSEVAIPIRLGSELIGILDIQSLKENAFSTEELEVFDILASQVGIAIQNARLFEENVRSLKDAEGAFRRLSGNTWNNVLQQLDTKAYTYDGVSSRPTSDAPSIQKQATLTVPVTIRGKVIGNLRLNPLDPNRSWTEDEIAITNAIAERTALALEGARLLEDAQKRASRESFLADVASKLSTSFQLDSILRDTVEELGQTLSGSTVSFQLINPSTPTNGDKSNGHSKKAE
jgi:PAS domain S-box-containing protein